MPSVVLLETPSVIVGGAFPQSIPLTRVVGVGLPVSFINEPVFITCAITSAEFASAASV